MPTKTVFVLGAGASKRYGYPSGAELKDEIVKGTLEGYTGLINLRGTLQQTLQPDKEQITDFGNALAGSAQASVDAFLEKRKQFLEIGKQSIAIMLMAREHPRSLTRTSDLRWYDWLWDRLDNGVDGFVDHGITVVTFNYDRSLEQYLGVALRDSYMLDDSAIRTQLATLGFIHVYGTIGGRPFLDEDARPYGPSAERVDIVHSANSINIIDRDQDAAKIPAITEAVEALAVAQHVYFLGFGYLDTNVKRLQLPGAAAQLRSGTVLGFTYKETKNICQRLKLSTPSEKQLRGHPTDSKTPMEMNCTEFLRHYATLQIP